MPLKILIVKLSSLGDVVQTLPVVADLHAACAERGGCEIDWVVEEGFAAIPMRLVGPQGLKKVIPIAQRRWRRSWKSWFSAWQRQERAAFKAQLREDCYDVVIDAQGLIKSALVARAARLSPDGKCGSFANASDACSYEWPVRHLLPHNQPMPTRIHAVARTRLLAAHMLGYQDRTDIWQAPPQVDFQNLPEDNLQSKNIMLTHGTTRADNQWPLLHWMSLALELVALGYRLLLPQANSEELAFCDKLKSLQPDAIDILPRMDLSSLLNQMALCHSVIGVDSGLSHMAVALGLPHVQLFSQDRAWRAGPVGNPKQCAVGGACPPSVQDVFAAWQRVCQA